MGKLTGGRRSQQAARKPARKGAKPAPRKPAKASAAPGKRLVTERAAPADALPAGVHLSITQLAGELGKDRDTIAKKIAEASLVPSGQRNGYAVYRLKDVLEAMARGASGTRDPDSMSPFERQAHYRAEMDKLRVQTERGELCPRIELESVYADFFKLLAQRLDTLPDKIERDLAVPGSVVAYVERELDAWREAAHAALLEYCTATAAAEAAAEAQLPLEAPDDDDDED
jgi:hypothetical protein